MTVNSRKCKSTYWFTEYLEEMHLGRGAFVVVLLHREQYNVIVDISAVVVGHRRYVSQQIQRESLHFFLQWGGKKG